MRSSCNTAQRPGIIGAHGRAASAILHRGADDRAEHTQSIADCVEVAVPVHAAELATGYFDDRKSGAGDEHVQPGLDLEPVDVDVDELETVAPEGVVAVAEVRVPR